MIIYNVTCNVEKGMAEEWLQWMLHTHIPEVMASGCFQTSKVLRLLTQADDDEGINYAIQYTTTSVDEYKRYQRDFGPALRQKTLEKYGDKVMAFRSLLEEVG